MPFVEFGKRKKMYMRVQLRGKFLTSTLKIWGTALAALLLALQPLSVLPIASAATASVTQLAFATPDQTIDTDAVSTVMTVQTQNVGNTSELLDTPSTKLLPRSSSPTGEFSPDGSTGWTATPSFTMSSGSSNKNFYYKDSSVGTFALTAAATDNDSTPYPWTPASQNITVNTVTPAAPTSVVITNVTELRHAIENQVDGQTWTINAGDYGIDRFNDIMANGQTGWYLPITANNLTINGDGNPTLFGQEYSSNGNLSSQNLMTIFGDNVTVNGLTLMPAPDPNKTIEVLGSNFTLEETTITPNTKVAESVYDNIAVGADRDFAKQWGGSIYFSHAGNHTLQNVTINNAGVSFRYAPANTHITFDNVNIIHETNIDSINAYRYSSGFNDPSNTNIGLPKVTYNVNNTLDNLDSVLAGAQDGDTSNINSNLTASHQIDITKALTINGNYYTITAASSMPINKAIIAPSTANGLKISNLTVDGAGVPKLHGINAFKSTMELYNVTVKNNTKYGLVVNSSNVIVEDIKTANNGWGGIDVDQNDSSSTLPSVLTVKGTSSHNETGVDIYVDNKTVGKVVDVDGQYDVFEKNGAYIYVASAELDESDDGTVSLPASSGVATTPVNRPLTLSSSKMAVVIPEGTTITASDSAWDGTLLPPTARSYVAPVTNNTTYLAITVGSNDFSLTFDKAVRLVLSGQAGKRVGFVVPGGVFTEIKTVCSADDQTVLDPPLASQECSIDSGDDLVVWTKHFTTFATFAQSQPTDGSSKIATSAPASSIARSLAFGFATTNSDQNTTSGTDVSDSNGQVLGTNTDGNTNDTKKSDDKSSDSTWTIFGMAWYWWIVILAAVAALAYIVARRRGTRA